MSSFRLASALAFATVLSLSIGARAQSKDPNVREAEKHFQSGVALYGEHDFKGALAEFQRAYQLAPNAAVLYNIGQTDFELQDYAGSLDAFTRYMAEGKPSKARQQEVQTALEALKSRVGTIDITTNVDDSTVLVDDVSQGKSPLSHPVTVSVGQRKVTVSHDGYPSANRIVTIASGDAIKLEIDLDSPQTIVVPGPDGKPLPPVVEPPEDTSSSNVVERPGKTYLFIGARYHGTVLPKFVLNAFISGGTTVYQNSAGIELDVRKDNFSIIPSIDFAEYGMGDTLFLQKGKDPNDGSYWSNIHSQIKGIYVNVDFLWSAKVNKYVDFEYGAGFGLGVLFGTLETSWVYSNQNGQYVSDTGAHFSECVTEKDSPQCTRASHQNSDVAKVNHYHEPFWSGGGSIPNVFPQLVVPQFGVRIKPVREMEMRVGLGVSVTGFFFGVSGDYAIEKKNDASKAAVDPQ
ncbi:MAG TPA: PEGA domain-containing protein [Polyangiaceae bacterium]